MTSHLHCVTSLVATLLLLLSPDLTSSQSTADQRFTQTDPDDGEDTNLQDLTLYFQQQLNACRSSLSRESTRSQKAEEQRCSKAQQLQQVQQERRYNESLEGVRRELMRTLQQWRNESRMAGSYTEGGQHSHHWILLMRNHRC